MVSVPGQIPRSLHKWETTHGYAGLFSSSAIFQHHLSHWDRLQPERANIHSHCRYDYIPGTVSKPRFAELPRRIHPHLLRMMLIVATLLHAQFPGVIGAYFRTIFMVSFGGSSRVRTCGLPVKSRTLYLTKL